MNKDTIYREDAIKAFDDAFSNIPMKQIKGIVKEILKIRSGIEEVPSADRPQGEWIAKDGVFYCSCCDSNSAGLSEDDVYVYDIPLPNYCKDCGARMRGADNETL